MAKIATIMVADDDPIVRQITRGLVGQLGAEIVEAANGLEAVEKFAAHRPSLVLLDVSMPGQDGYAACKQIRKLDGAKDVPIIMVTSFADSDSVKQAMNSGATDYFTKPVNWANLRAAIEKYLQSEPAADPTAT